jgi:hypothetical protein
MNTDIPLTKPQSILHIAAKTGLMAAEDTKSECENVFTVQFHGTIQGIRY